MTQAVQLLARGIQDEWLSGNPQVSFYRSQFKRHVPFGSLIEQFVVPVDGKIIINAKGDLLGYTYITAHDTTTGALVPNVNWSNVISTVDLVIGNQVIATHDITYINTIQKALEADTYSKRSQTNTFQPFGFFFDKQVLPIAALKYADVNINITWVSASVSKQYVYKCWSHCIHLAEDERRFFSTATHRLLIPQMQRVRVTQEPSFHGPVKYIAAPCINYSNVYYPQLQTQSTTVQWGARIAGTGNDQGTGISVDGSGNVYITGYYDSNPVTTLYNSDGSAFGTTLPLSGLQDCFIAKYNTSGTVQWGARIAGNASDLGYAISVDSLGNLYVTGYYSSSPLTLYNSGGSAFATTLPLSGLQDCFVAKYNTSGTVQWGARIAGSGDDQGTGISVDGSGNLYVIGRYASNPLTLYNSGGSAFATTLPLSGGNDCFIAKYNTSGTVQWGARIAGPGNDQGTGISVDGLGNLYVTGYYASNPLTLYNSDGSAFATTLPTSGSFDCFIAKYNTSGTVQWGARIAGPGSDQGNGISVDGSGNLYVTGQYTSNPLTLYNSDGSAFGTTLPLSGGTGCFVAKYNTSGTVQWGARIAGTLGFGISVDGLGNLYVTGYYSSNPLTLYNSDGSAFGTTLPNSGTGNYDCFIVKYNA